MADTVTQFNHGMEQQQLLLGNLGTGRSMCLNSLSGAFVMVALELLLAEHAWPCVCVCVFISAIGWCGQGVTASATESIAMFVVWQFILSDHYLTVSMLLLDLPETQTVQSPNPLVGC